MVGYQAIAWKFFYFLLMVRSGCLCLLRGKELHRPRAGSAEASHPSFGSSPAALPPAPQYFFSLTMFTYFGQLLVFCTPNQARHRFLLRLGSAPACLPCKAQRRCPSHPPLACPATHARSCWPSC